MVRVLTQIAKRCGFEPHLVLHFSPKMLLKKILYYLKPIKHLRNKLADDMCYQADEVQMFQENVSYRCTGQMHRCAKLS